MPPATRAQVREQLTSITQCRIGTVRDFATPAIVSAVGGGLLTAAWVLDMLWRVRSIPVGIVLFVLGVWISTRGRCRGRILDGRTTWVQTVTFMGFLVPVIMLLDLLCVNRPLRGLVIVGAWTFAHLRVEEHYQNRRCTSGDFDSRSPI